MDSVVSRPSGSCSYGLNVWKCLRWASRYPSSNSPGRALGEVPPPRDGLALVRQRLRPTAERAQARAEADEGAGEVGDVAGRVADGQVPTQLDGLAGHDEGFRVQRPARAG